MNDAVEKSHGDPLTGRYPPPRGLPPGVLRFGIVSVAAAALVGVGVAVWLTSGSIAPNGDPAPAFAFALNVGLTIVLLTAVLSIAPVLAAIIAGRLVRRMRSLLARASAVAFAVAVTAGAVFTVFFSLPADGTQWSLVVPSTAIAALGLALSAVLPWRGGFASRRYDPETVVAA